MREPVFARIWAASLLSNFGQLILGVGVAWEMTRLTSSPSTVALVQTAMMLPLVLVTVPAGAIADMFDRRRIAMVGLGFAMICAVALATLALFDLTTPWVLLAFCSLIGAGVALYSPSWQASIGEQVSRDHLPAAVALGAISHNVARSFGPALGGLIVLAAGAQAAFAVNAICYLPLFLAFYLWRREHVPSRLPPERIHRAIVSGVRYSFHSSSVRTVLARAFLFGLANAAATALAPLIAKDQLGGDVGTYGMLLGASGVGAVCGALSINSLRERFGVETATRLLPLVSGLAMLLVGFSHSLPLTCFALVVAGGTNILTVALLNISLQMAVPRWVTARALSLFSSALVAGIAVGAWISGEVASIWSVEAALLVSGAALLAMPLIALLLPLPETSPVDAEPVLITAVPEVGLAITQRSGPVVIEMDYDVDPASARDFYDVMLKVQRTRLRNGGFDWSLARDIGTPSRWTERYQCPTWGDYLRMRARFTQADRIAQQQALSFDRTAPSARTVRRQLERPFGSVRWRADSPDLLQDQIDYIGP